MCVGSCLRAIRRLQQFGHLPSDYAIFKSYAASGNFYDVRIEALKALVDFTKGEIIIVRALVDSLLAHTVGSLLAHTVS